MANEDHLSILKQGIFIWNNWREDHSELTPKLSDVDLHEANLSGVDLSRANLSNANLSNANLSNANLSRANLSNANLRITNLSVANLSAANFRNANLSAAHLYGANLRSAYLCGTDFRGADLSNANLRGVDLSYADLCGADLSNARLSGTNLSSSTIGWSFLCNVDLSEVKGLDTVQHKGPSTIGIDTIYKSKGNIPNIFLRGAGVPESFITFMKSLPSTALEFCTCFISYSSKDQDFANRLHADLQAKGVRCWFAPHNIQAGKKIHEQIDQAIRVYDKFLLILSEDSMGSEWVKTEVYNARQQEVKENKRKLFPISLVDYPTIHQWHAFDADIGKDMAREVREYYIPNFAHWKDHDTYQKAFDRLMRDLKSEE